MSFNTTASFTIDYRYDLTLADPIGQAKTDLAAELATLGLQQAGDLSIGVSTVKVINTDLTTTDKRNVYISCPVNPVA